MRFKIGLNQAFAIKSIVWVSLSTLGRLLLVPRLLLPCKILLKMVFWFPLGSEFANILYPTSVFELYCMQFPHHHLCQTLISYVQGVPGGLKSYRNMPANNFREKNLLLKQYPK